MLVVFYKNLFLRSLRKSSRHISNIQNRFISMSNSTEKMFRLESFCIRQFDDPNYSGTKLQYDKKEFEKKINEAFESGQCELVDGYAPFCKHLFIENFTDTRLATAAITSSNLRHLRCDYESRTPKELPVLSRWFPSHLVTPQVAKYLDVILYSREQINKENEAMGTEEEPSNSPWGIISVKAQEVPTELPMQPITIMRNALGKSEGGSGVPLKRDDYLKAVEYWKDHATIKEE